MEDIIARICDQADRLNDRITVLGDGARPPLKVKAIVRPGQWWTISGPADLDCPEGTVIEASDGYRYYKLAPGGEVDWRSDMCSTYTRREFWLALTNDARDGVTFEYSGIF